LVSRIVGRPDLRSRVTICTESVDDLQWPDRIGGFVAIAMLGHLTPPQRTALWAQLANRLSGHAPVIVHLQPPSRAEPVPRSRHTVERIGARTYEGWNEAEPLDDRTLRWHLTYRVLEDGHLVDEQRWTSDFHTIAFDDVVDEAAAEGLVTEAAAEGLVVLRRAT
jgi:hypothetical protein